ncbi:hypothetical protein FA95DRAFT_806124 [Auriscalpium vulgare]|uniref:Uncharacterized protein n=1 Tax=Auriscalpium vulgare TaxID=40419 RepID=A0ACB8R9U2_9AGAM|nr:hypothetical protein FA95DRAFT_806124 [Auriscalpium vulgare]
MVRCARPRCPRRFSRPLCCLPVLLTYFPRLAIHSSCPHDSSARSPASFTLSPPHSLTFSPPSPPLPLPCTFLSSHISDRPPRPLPHTCFLVRTLRSRLRSRPSCCVLTYLCTLRSVVVCDERQDMVL